MNKSETIKDDVKAVANISSLRMSRQKRGWTQKDVSRLSGVGKSQIHDYEAGAVYPTKKNYNKLAQVFGWDTVHIGSKRIEPPRQTQEIVYLATLPDEPLPRPVKFTFEEGHTYHITERQADPRKPDSRPYEFKYEGQQGIHHVFREVSGNWTRTYTDAQLIGKRREEVDERGKNAE